MASKHTMAPNYTGQPKVICTIEEAISECERELQVRRRCYDRWIQDGKLSAIDARDRLQRLEGAIRLLEAVQEAAFKEQLLRESAEEIARQDAEAASRSFVTSTGDKPAVH